MWSQLCDVYSPNAEKDNNTDNNYNNLDKKNIDESKI